MSEEENLAKVDAGEEGDDGDNGPAPEEESTATFTPVVQLEKIEVKTHEEDEDVVYKQRGKLFLYGETMLDKGTGTKTWKERGVGDVKFLRHKESSRIRVLMRQEKTMKVLVNHFLDPRIVLVPNVGNDRSWCWVAFDFAEGTLIETTFALRFSTAEVASEFKKAFLDGQEEMGRLLKGEDAKQGGAEAEQLSEAIESLTVQVEESKTEDAVAPAEEKTKAAEATSDAVSPAAET